MRNGVEISTTYEYNIYLIVLQEFCVKKNGRFEVLAMIGLFGTIFSVTEMYPFLWYTICL